jgi:hypothetical protein
MLSKPQPFRVRREDDAVAALLLAADRDPHWAHNPWLTGCRRPTANASGKDDGECMACRLDDVAAAFLGEEPQP